jgi:transglutaminase-like putative cysteine protease
MDAHSWFFQILLKLIKWIGLHTIFQLALLFFLLEVLILAVDSSVREISSGYLLFITTAGLLLSWILARSDLKTTWSLPSLFLGGVGAVLLSGGRLWQPLLQLIIEGLKLATQTIAWTFSPGSRLPAQEAFQAAGSGLAEAVQAAALRGVQWMGAVLSGQPAFDPLVSVMVWGAAMWACSAWAGYTVRRRRSPLPGMLPAGVLLASILNYTRSSSFSLLAFIGLLLILVLYVKHVERQAAWEGAGMDYPESVGLDLSTSALPVLVLILFAAAVIPSISTEMLFHTARPPAIAAAQPAERAAEALGIEKSRGTSLLEQWNRGGMPRAHLLSAGRELSEQKALVVKTGDYPPGSKVYIKDSEIPFYYWRSMVFDTYTGTGWVNPAMQTQSYRAGERQILRDDPAGNDNADLLSGYRLLEHSITTYNKAEGLIFSAGLLVAVDQPYQSALRTTAGDSPVGLSSGQAYASFTNSSMYRVKSLQPQRNQEVLTSSRIQNYSNQGIERYLSLPDNIPARVYSLALDLTAHSTSPYEQAKAIEAALRSMPYDLEISAPLAGRDAVDYYLFDLQRGYCDYAASAMVVLARAAGLPARLVMGYAGGVYNASRAEYQVSEANAHSWAEVYISGAGWVEFEPTGTMPDADRIEEQAETAAARLSSETLAFESFSPAKKVNAGLIAAAAMLLPVLLAAGLVLVDVKRLERLPPAAAVESVYLRLRRLGLKYLESRYGERGREYTPLELAEALSRTSRRAAGGANRLVEHGWRRVFTPPKELIESIIQLYIQTVYSPHGAGLCEKKRALYIWRQLRGRMWLAQRMQKFVERRYSTEEGI